MKWLYRIICAILIVVMAVSGYKIWSIMSEYKEGEDAYGELEQFVSIPSELPVLPSESGEEENPDGTPAPQATENLNQFPVVDFNSLKGINPDVMAWIYIPGTHVNYPVVQGSDNEYYLNRLFTGKWNSAGAIFMDYRNEADLTDPHTIIYGHQMNNKTMFNDLRHYADQSFYEEHTVGYLMIGYSVDLPVVQRENDNEYYLTHAYSGEKAREGALFLDGREYEFEIDPQTGRSFDWNADLRD